MSNKFKFLSELQIINENALQTNEQNELDKIVEDSLDKYVGFRIKEKILKPLECYVFGGAVRDSIANHSFGYKEIQEFAGIDLTIMYLQSDILLPYTFMKNDKIIQLIRPRDSTIRLKNDSIEFLNFPPTIRALKDFIGSVDLSCCAVGFSEKVEEFFQDAISDCKQRKFKETFSKLYSKRIFIRKQKLMERGWRDYTKHDFIERSEYDTLY